MTAVAEKKTANQKPESQEKKPAKKPTKKTTGKTKKKPAKKPTKKTTRKSTKKTVKKPEKPEKEVRKGRQTPTKSFVLPYTETKGEEAIKLYEKSGRTAQEWQQLLVYDMLAVNEDGLWVHSKYGYSVSRRNGKNEVVAIRELEGLKLGEHILHTAHRTTTSHTAWERLMKLCEQAKLNVTNSYKAYGKERIEVLGGGVIEFRTRTSAGGLGEGFDLLVIDEAQEYQDDQESTLKYTVSSSTNPQTILCGTPPTPVSSGTVFVKLREKILQGRAENSGWAEWSVDKMTDPHDREAWYECNPSLGSILTERKIADEIGDDDVDFNIQRLGLWLRQNLHSAISENEWNGLRVAALPKLVSELFVGVKFTSDSAALAIAVKTAEGKTFTEVVDRRDTRSGVGWITDFIIQAAPQKVVIDGQNGQSMLYDSLKDAKVKTAYLPKVAEVIEANGMLEPMIVGGEIQHAGQPALVQAATNCEHRAIGTNGGYGYKAIKAGVDIALLDCCILAIWAANKFKEKRPAQKIGY